MATYRDADGPMGRVVAGLNAFNQRHPWSHNDHFHGWVLRHLPAQRRRALDVGCGEGLLAERLATRFAHVDAIDRDAEMVRRASDALARHGNVTVRQQDFLDTIDIYDLITMVAVLHHLDLVPALRHAAATLSTGGRLLVVGLATPATRTDVAVDLVSAALNPMVGLVKHPHLTRSTPAGPPYPVMDPQHTFGELQRIAGGELPGATMRRQLFFRHTLEWTKP